MAKDQLYSESEIAEIVRRAAELQEQGSAKGYVPGVTGEELSRLAAEVGIDPVYLDKALSERLSGQTPPPKAKGKNEIERVLPVEIRPENFDLITESVRIMPTTTTNGVTTGGMSQVGRSMTGQIMGGWTNPYFKITSRGGRTKLNVWTGNETAVVLSFLWLFPLIFGPIVAGKLSGALAAGLVALACVVGCIASFWTISRKVQQITREVAKEMESAILQAAEELELRPELSQLTGLPEETTAEQEVRESS